MIPKIIHYCWFNEAPLPMSLRICMHSWKKQLPDYEFKLWDIHSFDVNSLDWTREAYELGALAFVSDYVRLYALYTEGGIYMDTDVFVKKTFDPLLENRFFTAIEYHPEVIEADKQVVGRLSADGANCFPGVPVPGIQLLSAILGAEKGHPFIAETMKFYQETCFVQADGSRYIKIIAPDILALTAEKFGLKYNKDIEQHLQDGITIYPSRILGAAWVQVTVDTIAVHLSKGSWRKRSWFRNILTKFNFYRKILGVK